MEGTRLSLGKYLIVNGHWENKLSRQGYIKHDVEKVKPDLQ